MKVRGLGDAVPIRAGARGRIFSTRFFVEHFDLPLNLLTVEKVVGFLMNH